MMSPPGSDVASVVRFDGVLEETVNIYPCMPSEFATDPLRENDALWFVLSVGHKTRCIPTVAKPTNAPSMRAMKQRETFSLHACWTAFSFRPPIELNNTPGAQKVTTREKRVQASHPSVFRTTEGPDATGAVGLINGTGAMLLSGFVRVLARRRVPEVAGGRVVGMGTSEES